MHHLCYPPLPYYDFLFVSLFVWWITFLFFLHSISFLLQETANCLLFKLRSLFLRVKIIIEEIERDEEALKDDLYSADRKFAEYYNVSSNLYMVLYLSFVLISEPNISMPFLLSSSNSLQLICNYIYPAFQVLEQILGVLIKLVKDLKLQNQHKYVSFTCFLYWWVLIMCLS